jgi:hypothetical protein
MGISVNIKIVMMIVTVTTKTVRGAKPLEAVLPRQKMVKWLVWIIMVLHWLCLVIHSFAVVNVGFLLIMCFARWSN